MPGSAFVVAGTFTISKPHGTIQVLPDPGMISGKVKNTFPPFSRRIWGVAVFPFSHHLKGSREPLHRFGEGITALQFYLV